MSDKPKKDDKKPSNPPDDYQFPSLHEEAATGPVAEEKTVEPAPAPEAIEPAGPGKLQQVAAPIIARLQAWFLKNKGLGLIIVFAALAASMWGISVLRNRKGPDQIADNAVDGSRVEEVPVNAMEVKIGRFQDKIESVGTLKGEAEIELRFEVDGKIEEFNVMEGARVRKGQLIARLSDRDSRLKIQRAKIELEQTEKLYQIGGVSKTKLDEARLNMEVAQSERDKTHMTASRDGIIGDKGADIGEFVTPQRKIATLVAIRNVVMEVGIIEKLVDKVYPGQKILMTVDAYPGNVFEGTIETISPIIVGDKRTFSIRAKIPNPDSLLLPGMFVRSKIITYEADDAMSVPNDALVKTAGGFQVFVVNKDNVAEARDVQAGYVSTEFTQVQSGLNPGEIIVVQKPPELKSGNKVKIIEVQK